MVVVYSTPRAAWALVALAWLGSVAQAQAPTAPVTVAGLTFPLEVAGARIAASQDYESQHPGFGHTVRYLRQTWTLDIDLYDMRRRVIAEGPNSPPVREQLEHAAGEIIRTFNRAERSAGYVINDARGRARLQCASFVYRRSDRPGDFTSVLCVTGWKNKFVRFRMSAPRQGSSEADAKALLEAWTEILWPPL
jgi:hypothetical protein